MKLKIRNKNSYIKHVIRLFVIITLLTAYIIGYTKNNKQILSEFFSKKNVWQRRLLYIIKMQNMPIFAKKEKHELTNYCSDYKRLKSK